MTAKRKLKLKKPTDVPPVQPHHRFSSKEEGKIVVHSKRHSQQIAPHMENPQAAPTHKQMNLTRPRRKRQGREIVISVFVAIVAIAVVVLMVHHYQVKKLEERTEAYLLQQARIAAAETLPEFSAPLKTLDNIVASADGLMSNVANTVMFVTERPLEQFVSSVARRQAWLREQRERAESDAARQATETAPAPEESQPEAAEPVAPEEPISINGRDAPMGFEMKHIKQRSQRTESSPPDREVPQPPSGVSVDGRDAPAGIDFHPDRGIPSESGTPASTTQPINFGMDPEVVKLARKAITAKDSIYSRQRELKTLHQQARDHEYDAEAAKTSVAAAKIVDVLKKQLDEAKELVKRSETELAEMNTLTDTIRRVGIEEKQKRDAAAEAERKRRQAEAYKALVAKERTMVEQGYTSIHKFIPTYDFVSAVERLMFVSTKLQTQEAKNDLEPILDRIKLLADTKQEIITCLNEEQYHWGWGQGATALDIVGADDATIWIQGQKKIPWSEVSFPQFVKIAKHYVDRPQDKLSIRARRALALAVLCNEDGKPDEAKAWARMAVQLTDTVQADVDRLMPNL